MYHAISCSTYSSMIVWDSDRMQWMTDGHAAAVAGNYCCSITLNSFSLVDDGLKPTKCDDDVVMLDYRQQHHYFRSNNDCSPSYGDGYDDLVMNYLMPEDYLLGYLWMMRSRLSDWTRYLWWQLSMMMYPFQCPTMMFPMNDGN